MLPLQQKQQFMNYPLISEYIEAIKASEDNFDELKHLRPVLDDDGEPMMTSGNFAVVFKMRDEQTGKLHAVKCFLKEQEGRADAYRMIAEELEYVNSTFLTPIKYLDKELFVDSKNSNETEFPVLLMDWVEGKTLDKYIREHIDDQYELSLLAYQFSRLAMWLMPQPFAHGDLKPDNILVKDDGTLVLVDYDGMYVPAMKGQKARELGSPDFRHPSRTENDFDEHIDDFSLASILLSLKAISLQPSLLEEFGASDRLLFSMNDYCNLYESVVIGALKPLMYNAELAALLLIFISSFSQKNLSIVSIRFFNLSKPDVLQYVNSLSTQVEKGKSQILGKIEEIAGRKYLLIFDINSTFDDVEIEKEAIDGLRIISFTYKKEVKEIAKKCKYIDRDTRYGLVNEENELVSNYLYSSLIRQDNGNISALYPDPCDRYWKEDRFSCIINSKGYPLFQYNAKTKEGNKQPRYFALSNIDAVSSCYYGIALFVRNHKIGIVDYQGNELIKPIYDDIKIERSNDWLSAVLYDKEHYKGFDARPSESLANSITFLFHKSNYWPLHLHELNRKYYVKYKDKGIFFLKNKNNSLVCMCMYDGYRTIVSPEYQELSLLNYWYLDSKHIDSLYIAVNSEGKYGIISMPTDYEDVNPDTGEPIYNEIRTVCPFDNDYIANGSLENAILVKNGKEGLFSCSQKRIIVECVVPTIDQYTLSILPNMIGEGLIGCREKIESNSLSNAFKYLFYDTEGNKVLELPNGWEIKSAFKNGVAQIRTGKHIIKTADVDKFGNIKITKEEMRHLQDDSYDDIEGMYRDAFEDDPGMEWNID